jgi:hypothetical protein
MGTIVVKPERDVDFYVGWSSIVEAPVWWGPAAEVIEYMRDDARRGPSDPVEQRLARADETGTSAHDRRDGGWDDEGFIYEQRGFMRREHLTEMCRLLEAKNEPAVWDLLEPFEDEEEVRRG